ncbi:helix-turn-helix transcriptional regulator [Priestia endophytica]|uniref:helix-turn-helix domain-containing protein n=1 Tax=Priestia endophytica TaxID=135735 RepID=UPI002DDD5A70|nr:helix-turn-helix transcriptional regulator [Priestia endophytica]
MKQLKLGEQLKKLREERNMSREELAQKMNVSRQAVYKWENNKGYPDIQNLIRLSEIYGITVDELIKKDSTLQLETDIKEEEINAGFYIGIMIIFLGIFLGLIFDSLIFSIVLNMVGGLIIGFYESLIKLFQDVKKDFNKTP